MDPYLGEIRAVGFNFAPQGWAVCSGQILPISQNTALFSLFGTFYGGNGLSTFALPNLQGNVIVGLGQGPGLSPRDVGEVVGAVSTSLTFNTIPSHSHGLNGSAEAAPLASPQNAVPAKAVRKAYAAAPATGALHDHAVSNTGSTISHNNLQPYLCINYIVALQGIFPPRS